MRILHTVLLLLINSVLFSQTAIYSSDGILTLEIPTKIDVINGYPTADKLNSQAITYYNMFWELKMP